MRKISYSINLHDDYAELMESGRKSPLAIRRAEPEYIAEMMRRAAYELLQRAFYLDHNMDFIAPDYDREEQEAQIYRMRIENAPIETF